MSSQTFGGPGVESYTTSIINSSNSTYYAERKQIIVDLDKEFIRNPDMNLIIAVRDNNGTITPQDLTRFETRRLSNQRNTLTIGSDDPINLSSLPTNPTSSYNNPWIFLEVQVNQELNIPNQPLLMMLEL